MSKKNTINENWYLDDQFKQQLHSEARKNIVLNRFRIFREALFPLLEAGQKVDFLDAGCGDGINLQELEKLVVSYNIASTVTGIDYSKVRTQRAKKVVKGTVLEGSLLSLPFQNAFFDAVLCNHVLEHIENADQALSEIFRVLKPGGVLIVGVPNEGCLLASLRNKVLQQSILKTTDHVKFFTKTTLEKILKKNNFSVVNTVTEGFFFPHLRLANLLRSSKLGYRFEVKLGQLIPTQAAGLISICKRT